MRLLRSIRALCASALLDMRRPAPAILIGGVPALLLVAAGRSVVGDPERIPRLTLAWGWIVGFYLPLVVIMFAAVSTARDGESGSRGRILAAPVSPLGYVLGRFIGISIGCTAFTVAIGLVHLAIVALLGGAAPQGRTFLEPAGISVAPGESWVSSGGAQWCRRGLAFHFAGPGELRVEKGVIHPLVGIVESSPNGTGSRVMRSVQAEVDLRFTNPETGLSVVRRQAVRDDTETELDLPEGAVSPDRGATIEVASAEPDRSVIIGVRLTRTPNGRLRNGVFLLGRPSSYPVNLARAGIAAVAGIVALAALAGSLGAFLTLPVALLAALSIFSVSSAMGFLKDACRKVSFQGTLDLLLGAGPGHHHHPVHPPTGLDRFLGAITDGVVHLMPDYAAFRVHNLVSGGERISLELIGRAAFLAAVLSLVSIAAAAFALRWRER